MNINVDLVFEYNGILVIFVLKIVEKFEQLYETVDDIDLFIGGVSEKPVSGGITGPTFQVYKKCF